MYSTARDVVIWPGDSELDTKLEAVRPDKVSLEVAAVELERVLTREPTLVSTAELAASDVETKPLVLELSVSASDVDSVSLVADEEELVDVSLFTIV